MHIAYSALHPEEKDLNNNTALARYHGYQAACQKHSQTIAAIRQYIPGWEPPFQSAVNVK